MNTWPRRLLRTLWITLAGAVIAAAVLLSLARLLLPFADQLRPAISQWAAEALRQPVAIARLDADWTGWEPGLILEDATLLDPQGRPILHLRRARIGLDLWASLRAGAPVPGSIRISGLRLALLRDRDGRLRIEGLAGDGAGGGRDFARWLLTHKRIVVEDSELHYRDLSLPDPPTWRFQNVTIDLRNQRGRHLVDLTIQLPYQMGYTLALALDLSGDILSTRDWHGRAYLSVHGLRLAALPETLRSRAGVSIESGRLDLQLWSWWERGRPRRINGTVALEGLRLLRREPDRIMPIRHLSALLDWQGERDGRWWFAARRLRLHTGPQALPPTRLWLHYRPGDDDHPRRLELAADRFLLQDVAQLARFGEHLPPRLERLLDRLRPRARVEDLRLRWDDTRPPRLHLKARLLGLANDPWQWIPGSDGVDARLRLDGDHGQLELEGHRLQLRLARLYDHPLAVDRLRGRLEWRRAPRAWVLDLSGLHLENRHLAYSGRVHLRLPTDGRSPQLIMANRLRLPDPERLHDYLPRRLIAPGLRRWLDQALHRGAIEDADIRYLGRTHRFPFRADEGRFAARLDLRDARLTPAPGWPTIDAIAGRLRLDHRRLLLAPAEGRIYRSRLRDVRAHIPDLQRPDKTLRISGQVDSDGADLLRYLHQSPLEDAFAHALHPFQAHGPLRLGLKLEIPLHDAPVRVQGRAHLQDLHLSAPDYAVDLRHINGTVRFTETGLWADHLEAEQDGHPLKLALDTRPQQDLLLIDGSGRLHRAALRDLLARYTDYPHWADYVAGQTAWSGRLTIPFDDRPLTVALRSDLLGLAVTLPEPLAKAAQSPRPFRLQATLGPERRRLDIDYGTLRARLRLKARGEHWILHRGAIGLGHEPELPEHDGLWFSGHAPRFSWTAWSAVLFPEDGRPPLFPEEGSGTGPSQYYDLTIGELEVFDFHFQDVALQATDSAQGWTIHVRAPRLAGTAFVPLTVTTAPLRMDMQRIHLQTPPPEQRTPARTDPTELPAFVIDADDFRFDRLRFGRLTLRASRIPGGLRLDRLSMGTAVTDIQANGQWLVERDADGDPPPQTSRFHIEADSSDLGRTLQEWDYAGTIEGGRGRIVIDAHWPGNPAQFDLARLNGDLELTLEDGRLLNMDPGPARIFGLISLQALPRRLMLDFSDLFDKGFAFDRLTGRYHIENGLAHTDGLILEGPAARIIARGRIDLAQRRYDQEVAVIPRLGESLPLIGTALTGAPPVGTTLFLLQKLLEKPLSELSTIRYRVRGPWEAPQVERIQDDREPSEELLAE